MAASLTITIGPAKPRMIERERRNTWTQPTIIHSLAMLAARHARTTVIDEFGQGMVLGCTADEEDGDVELF